MPCPLKSKKPRTSMAATISRYSSSSPCPLIRPGILVASVFAFIMSWNEFLFALIIGREMRTMQVALMTTSGARGVMWEQMAAAGLVVMLPIFFLALFIRKNVVNGLTMGAVK